MAGVSTAPKKDCKTHPVVYEIANYVADQAFGSADPKTKRRRFVAVHLRRGDFMTLQGARDDLERDTAELRTCPRDHKIYIATNEQNQTALERLRGIGALLWSDLKRFIPVELRLRTEQLAFQDFVGLIEHALCASANVFVGSRSSSFTGHVLNLRGDMQGAWDPYYLLHQHRWDGLCR